MDERALLLLGILRAQSQHAYQINEFIERTLGRVADMKKPTAYALLDRLAQAGHVAVRTEQEGNRPPRKVYTISASGERLFFELLRANLETLDRLGGAGDIGMMFLDSLPPAEALALLEHRRAQLDEQIAAYERAPKHEHGVGVDLALDRQLTLLRADLAWLDGVIARLRQAPAV
ncbi:MAG TPA: helix-turn-helix transcriptional regulator [Ktedonobacterales bacterium]